QVDVKCGRGAAGLIKHIVTAFLSEANGTECCAIAAALPSSGQRRVGFVVVCGGHGFERQHRGDLTVAPRQYQKSRECQKEPCEFHWLLPPGRNSVAGD